jgi:hypothetical protein
MARKSNKEKVYELFKPNANGESAWVPVEFFRPAGLNWSTNGNARHGVFFGVDEFKWEKKSDGTNGSGTSHLRTAGWNKEDNFKQTIGTAVKKALAESSLCNLSLLPVPENLREIDHRYGNKTHPDYVELYKTANQRPEDFQIIYSVLNSAKRQICKVCCETQTRPRHPTYGFIEGGPDHTRKHPCKGCYLAEPERYRIV